MSKLLNNSPWVQKSFYWSDFSTHEFSMLGQSAAIASAVAVIPIAAVEQHGPHLPVGVDAALAQAMVNRVVKNLQQKQGAKPSATVAESHLKDQIKLAAQEDLDNPPPIFFLPLQSIGFSKEHQGFYGTLTLSSATILAVLSDIVASIAKTGIGRILFFNTHGGNTAILEIAARQARVEHGLLSATCNWFDLPLPIATKALFSQEEWRFGIHAGAIETSLMMAIDPDKVVQQAIENFESASFKRYQQAKKSQEGTFPLLVQGAAKLRWAIEDYNPQGACGDATQASADKGHLILDAVGHSFVELLSEISRLPLPQKSTKSA